MSRTVSIAIPTYCRTDMLFQSFAQVLDDPRVAEVVISDDCSPNGSWPEVLRKFSGSPKVKLHRNPRNLDCYRNKRRAVELCSGEWVILFDDDNVMGLDYLDRIWRIAAWEPKVIYCPDWAKPHFNYTKFSGITVDRKMVWMFMHVPHFKTALNTCNYFVHRQTYLDVWDGSVDPVTSDTLFHAYNWLVRGGRITIVQGLRYIHRVHEGSHYKNNWRRTGDLARRLEHKLMTLR